MQAKAKIKVPPDNVSALSVRAVATSIRCPTNFELSDSLAKKAGDEVVDEAASSGALRGQFGKSPKVEAERKRNLPEASGGRKTGQGVTLKRE